METPKKVAIGASCGKMLAFENRVVSVSLQQFKGRPRSQSLRC